MRDLKFRGWHTGDKGFVAEHNFTIDFNGKLSALGGLRMMPEKGVVVMQYTGLKDKKREVYESDLYELRVNGIETHVEIILCEVKWSNKGCGFGFFRLTKDSEQPQWIGMNDKNILGKKHLGNIHENPELLTK